MGAAAIYLDNNATTRPAPQVVDAMAEVLRRRWANPSSVHRAGQEARRAVELAREELCMLLGCEPAEVVFTSGGTEASNLAMRSALESPARRGRNIIVTSRLEHSATREMAEALSARGGVEVIWLAVDARGLIDRDHLDDVLRDRADEIALVTLQWANNETGAIAPVEAIGALCRERGVWFHCDATQWVGKMPLDLAALPIDMLTASAHKFHGPKGVGALFIRRGVRLPPAIIGGPQERERRGGTEHTQGIVGMGVAATLAREWLADADARETLARRRDAFESTICSGHDDVTVNQGDVDRLWNTSNIAFRGIDAEQMLLLLSERSVYASAGAACSSGSLDPSPVLLAMGLDPQDAEGSVRFSASRETTEEELSRAAEVINETAALLRSAAV